MTVLVDQSSKRFHGTGSAGPFTWPWRFLANTDIAVYRIASPNEDDPSTEELELLGDGDYLLTGAGSYTGGSLMLAAPLFEGEDLLIERRTEALQKVSIRNQGNNFLPATHEDAFDRFTMMVQDRDRDAATNIEDTAGLKARMASAENQIYDLGGRPDSREVDARNPAFASLASCIESVSATGGGTVVVLVPMTINNMTRPDNVQIAIPQGGSISVSDGNLFDWNGGAPVGDPQYQIFDGDGRVVGLRRVRPEWRGAIGDNTVDDATAFAAMASDVNATTDFAPTIIFDRIYKYSDGLSFSREVTLEGKGTLNYTGTGKAVELGPTGLTLATFQKQYEVRDVTFTGGGSMSHGIYISNFVTYPKFIGVKFKQFGAADTWALYAAGDNWDVEVTQCEFLNIENVARHWIYMAGMRPSEIGGGNPLGIDFGNSRLRFVNNHFSATGYSGSIAIYVTGHHSEISHSKLEGGSPVVRVGAYASDTDLHANYYESYGNNAVIQFGELPGHPLAATIIYGLKISDSYANLHNVDAGATGYFIAPTNTSAGLRRSSLRYNSVSETVPTKEHVRLNDIAGQIDNEAYGNFTLSDPFQTRIHTLGSNISPWRGTQGEKFRLSARHDSTTYHELWAGNTTNQYNGFEFQGPEGVDATIEGWRNGSVGALNIKAGAANTGLLQLLAGTVMASGKVVLKRLVVPDDSSNYAVPVDLGNEFVATVSNGAALSIYPTGTAVTGQRITIRVINASGGAMGVISWSGVLKMATWTNPANGFSRSIDFQFDGTDWIEVSRTPADIPN